MALRPPEPKARPAPPQKGKEAGRAFAIKNTMPGKRLKKEGVAVSDGSSPIQGRGVLPGAPAGQPARTVFHSFRRAAIKHAIWTAEVSAQVTG